MKLTKPSSWSAAMAPLFCAAALFAAMAPSLRAQSARATESIKPRCDRSCLEGVMNRYLDAMVAHDPSRASLAPNVKYAQDNVPLNIGQALGAPASGVGN